MPTLTKKDPLTKLVDKITEMSSLPSTAARIMEAVQDPRSGAADLMRVLQADPSLTSRVLRTVNSAAYGLSERVTNLQSAIAYLGFNQIRNLALTAAIAPIFRDGEEVGPYSRVGLWKHLVGVGIASRMVARRLELKEAEEAYVAGLLHDIGIILLDQYAHPQQMEALNKLNDAHQAKADNSLSVEPGAPNPLWLRTHEREVLTFDHCDLGAAVAKNWRFPEGVAAVIRFHHEAAAQAGGHKVLVQCVQAANIVCTLKGVASVGRPACDCGAGIFQELGFSKVDLKVIAADLDAAFEQNRALFDMIS